MRGSNPQPRTGMFVFYLLNLFREYLYQRRDSNPHGHCCPEDFLTTFAFTRTIFSITCSDVVVWTISSPFPFRGLGATCIVSTPFIDIAVELSEPPPKNIFLYSRFLFVRVVLHSKFPCDLL